MSFSFSGRALAALVLGGLFLGSCGGNGTSTNTPSSTLGTDSAATKVGGMPDSAGTGAMNSTAPGTSATGTSPTGSSPAGTAGTPTVGGTGASGTTNSTGAN
ncbi:MAG: hypothetical protein ACRYF0_08995 [Janthinobacterium lividum]